MAKQLLNYLRATSIEVGLLLNFGPKAVAARKVYDNERKGNWARKNTEKKGEEWDMDVQRFEPRK